MSTEDRRIELARVSDILAWKMSSDCSQINLDNVVQSKVTDTLTTPAEIYGIARKGVLGHTRCLNSSFWTHRLGSDIKGF